MSEHSRKDGEPSHVGVSLLLDSLLRLEPAAQTAYIAGLSDSQIELLEEQLRQRREALIEQHRRTTSTRLAMTVHYSQKAGLAVPRTTGDPRQMDRLLVLVEARRDAEKQEDTGALVMEARVEAAT